MEQCKKRRQRIPDVIANAPQLEYGQEVFYEAFAELSTERHPGYSGVLPIPASKIREYGIRIGYVEEEDNDYFYDMVRVLDLSYCKHLNGKFEAERKRMENGNL